MKHHLVVLFTTATFGASLLASEARTVEGSYAPWSVDEYQLFGRTTEDITRQFDAEIKFSPDYRFAWLRGDRCGPQFQLTYTNGRVSAVQRVFVDGGGCAISGPLLQSKIDALQFFVNGMDKLAARTAREEQKLDLARQSLVRLTRTAAA